MKGNGREGQERKWKEMITANSKKTLGALYRCSKRAFHQLGERVRLHKVSGKPMIRTQCLRRKASRYQPIGTSLLTRGAKRKCQDTKGNERKGKETKGKETKAKKMKGKENERKWNDMKGHERKGKERKGTERKGKELRGRGNEMKGIGRTWMEIKGNERKWKSKETLETLNVLSVLPTS